MSCSSSRWTFQQRRWRAVRESYCSRIRDFALKRTQLTILPVSLSWRRRIAEERWHCSSVQTSATSIGQTPFVFSAPCAAYFAKVTLYYSERISRKIQRFSRRHTTMHWVLLQLST